MKRALILVGAGASLEYGAPSTSHATQRVRKEVLTDKFMKYIKSDRAYTTIARRLATYFGGRGNVNFEQIFHCAHELLFTYPPTSGAVNEFKPVLHPFLQNVSGIPQAALKPLAEQIIRSLYTMFSEASQAPQVSLSPLHEFISSLRRDCTPRIYTTNYDDFILQSIPDLFYGFSPSPSSEAKRFDPAHFWEMIDVASVTHLHGSIHMGFHTPSLDNEMGELFWYDDLGNAKRNATFSGGLGSTRRMDGSSYMPTSIVTGLDKTSSLQQSPFIHFYAGLGRDLVAADIIYVIGSGLSDLHINAWLREARNRKPKTPIILVDFWREGLAQAIHGDWDRKMVEIVHALKIPLLPGKPLPKLGSHWTITSDAAVWDAGFGAFLDAPDEHAQVLQRLARTP